MNLIKKYFLFAAKSNMSFGVGLMIGVVPAIVVLMLVVVGGLLFNWPIEVLNTTSLVLGKYLVIPGIILGLVTWTVRKTCIIYKSYSYGRGVYVRFGGGPSTTAGNPLWVGPAWFRRGETCWCSTPCIDDDNRFDIASRIAKVVDKTHVLTTAWLSVHLSSPEFDAKELHALMSDLRIRNDVERSLGARFASVAKHSTEVRGVFASIDPRNTLAFTQSMAAALKKVPFDRLYLKNVESVTMTKVVVTAKFGRRIVSEVTALPE